MIRTIARTLIVYAVFASIPFTLFAQPGPIAEREALARELRNARLPLESGLAMSRSEGTPISAKYEIDNGRFQLSVYTMKGDKFSEVILDYSVGTITSVEAIQRFIQRLSETEPKTPPPPPHAKTNAQVAKALDQAGITCS